MLSARQLLLMRRARDRTIGVAKAPIGTVALLPDPDFRRRVLRCVSHVGLLSLDMNRIRGRSARCRVHWSVGRELVLQILFDRGISDGHGNYMVGPASGQSRGALEVRLDFVLGTFRTNAANSSLT